MNWFKNLKVSGKLLTGFTFASIIAVLIGIISYSSLNSTVEGKNEIYEENLLPNEAPRRRAAGYQKLVKKELAVFLCVILCILFQVLVLSHI